MYGALPDLHDSLQYIQVITQHLPVVMVTMSHNKVHQTTH